MQKVAVTCVLALFALLTSYAIVLAWPDRQAVAAHTSSHDTLTRLTIVGFASHRCNLIAGLIARRRRTAQTVVDRLS